MHHECILSKAMQKLNQDLDDLEVKISLGVDD